MSNNTPEERSCQAPTGKNVDICKAIAAQYSDKEAEKAREILALANNPREKELVEALIKEAVGKEVVLDTSKAVCRGGITPSELNNIVQEVSGKPLQTPITKVIESCNQSTESPAKKKAIEESRKLIDKFSKNLATYPKPLTYEGSVVFCVAISVSEGTSINLNGLPQVDRELVLSQLPADAETKLSKYESSINVDFDEVKDFILTYHSNKSDPIKLKYFNTVIHPQKLSETNVPVEKEGGKVTVGTHLVLDQRRIAKLVGLSPSNKSKEDEEEPPRRQPAANRNAYEIRADVLQMAIDWVREKDEYNQKDENDVLNLAKKFYTFVEDRRR
jgi:hypothetical protein